MNTNVVARRYAKALFSVAQQQKKSLEIGNGLNSIAEVLSSSSGMRRVFESPIFSVKEKKMVVGELIKKMKINATVNNFCKLLAEKGRLEMFLAIRDSFNSLQRISDGVVEGHLSTAIPLTDSQKKSIKMVLDKKFNQKIILNYSTDNKIIGGLVLQVGDRIMDASIRAQLHILQDNIKRGE